MNDMLSKVLFVFLISLFSLSLALAQDNSTVSGDELYLKNGKVIKGSIQKEELGVVSILVVDTITNKTKIQMYQQNDISRIMKTSRPLFVVDTIKSNTELLRKMSQVRKNLSAQKGSDLYNSSELRTNEQSQDILVSPMPAPKKDLQEKPVMIQVYPIPEGEQLAAPIDPVELAKAPKPRRRYLNWYRQIRGFRAFIEYGCMLGIGHTKNHKMEVLTSLGFQFNPIFYVGMGTGGALTLNDKDHSLPVFINGRMNFLDEYTTPYLDVKTGYSVLEGRGFYFSASLGVSFTNKGGNAFNLGLTYTSQNVKYYEWNRGERSTVREAQHGLGLRMALEF